MTDTVAPDEVLMGRYARGDAAAFESLYRRHEMRTWRYIDRSVGNRASAEELMQEVWFAVAREAPRYHPSARFTTWLFTIARNRIIDWVRTQRPQTSLDSIGCEADPAFGPLAAAVASEQASALARALAQLPVEQRDAFLMHIEAGLSVEEIAAVAGVNFETAKSRLRYARVKLRELLQEHA
jgi:RNA polymerase sigma factor (sigma-70 family)